MTKRTRRVKRRGELAATLNDFKKILNAHRRMELRAEKIADAMVACLGKRPNRYMLHMVLPPILGQKLMPLFEYDNMWPLYDSPFLKGIVDGYVESVVCPMISKALEKIWTYQKDKKNSYGDMDYYFTKYRLTDKVRVSVLYDVVTCSDDNRFIVIEDLEEKKVHIRVIVSDKKSDYPKKEYPHRLGLRFYRDRNFIMEFVKEWHMTNKGDVYGDCRDTGYVLTYSMAKKPFDRVEASLYSLQRIAHVGILLSCMSEEVSAT